MWNNVEQFNNFLLYIKHEKTYMGHYIFMCRSGGGSGHVYFRIGSSTKKTH